MRRHPLRRSNEADAGPYGNLFKGSGNPQTQSFDLSGGLFGGYDDTPLALAPGSGDSAALDPRFHEPGVTSGFNASAAYGYLHAGRGKSGTSSNSGVPRRFRSLPVAL